MCKKELECSKLSTKIFLSKSVQKIWKENDSHADHAHILHHYAPHAWMIGKNLSMKVQVPKRGKKFYRICSQICPGVFEITQRLSHKGGLIPENAGELLLLQTIYQISILNCYIQYMALAKKKVHKTDLWKFRLGRDLCISHLNVCA